MTARAALRSFLAALANVRAMAGNPSLRQLEKLTAGHRRPLTRQTVLNKLNAESVPGWDFVDAFLFACAAYARKRGQSIESLTSRTTWRARHSAVLAAVESADEDRRFAAAARTERSRVVPLQVPVRLGPFAGRATELSKLDRMLPVTIVSGIAGVGKTALVLHWAHQVRDQFPDGQLYVNLHGFEPDRPAMDPAVAIRWFLDALGVPPHQIPAGQEAQIALYQGLLGDRRMLVVLDNGRDTEHVRPLLPGSTGCLTVVTSRNHLTGLVAEGAAPLTLQAVSAAEAELLLSQRLGSVRLASEPGAVSHIIARCAGLPVALVIVAARAAVSPETPLHVFARELRESHELFDALASDSAKTDVRSVFSWSFRLLSPAAARLFRLMGTHLGPDISVPASASLAGVALPQAMRLLAELAQSGLVTGELSERYSLHDLLRAYAATLAPDSAEDRTLALHRVLDHYLRTALAAEEIINARGQNFILPEAQADVVPEILAGPGEAHAWFQAEHPVLLAAIGLAVEAGFDIHAWQIAWSLTTYLQRRGHWVEWAQAHQQALTATRRLGDRAAQAIVLRHLARAYRQLGRLDEAKTQLQLAIDIYDQTGDKMGTAHAHFNLALVWEREKSYGEALQHAEQALAAYTAAGHDHGRADALNAIGLYHAELGDPSRAVNFCLEAVSIQEELGSDLGLPAALDSLGYVRFRIGQYGAAIDCYQRALGLIVQTGDRGNEAITLNHLGDAEHARGEPVAARQAWQRALVIFSDLNHPDATQVAEKLR